MTITAESTAPQSEAAQSEVMRRAMIDSQLRTSGVNEPWVLAAMMRIPREDYLPATSKAAAYIDRAVPLGNGKSLAAPLVQGRMLTEAAPKKTDSALLVSDSNGYFAALLAPEVGSLTPVSVADGASGTEGGNGFTLLVIDGAIEQLPDALADALAEGGRVVTGLVVRGVTRLAVGRKAAGEVTLLPLAEMGIPVLAEFAAPKRWSF